MENHVYFCIDLKSFYASVECAERHLNPLKTDLVVADPERGEKTICLAVSPSLRQKGIKNRCRVFEIPPEISYIMASPRMKKYIEYSAEIYGLYLKYFSPEDIYVYSIDEVFIDVTPYLRLYEKNPKELAQFLLKQVYKVTGIPAACGIGTNLFLAKIALDITAKHSKNFIGILTEEKYRKELWDYKPLSDFWRIGEKSALKLHEIGIDTMGDLAHCNEDTLYELFGIDAELLIDHAWGIEPVTIEDIKKYQPKKSSQGSSQVLMRDYSWEEAEIVVKEMTEKLALELLSGSKLCSSVTLTVGYTNNSLKNKSRGSYSFLSPTDSSLVLTEKITALFEEIVDRDTPVRRISLSLNNTIENSGPRQISIFENAVKESSKKSKKLNKAVLNLKDRFGENAVLKGLDLQKAATAIERNKQIGGHKSGI